VSLVLIMKSRDRAPDLTNEDRDFRSKAL